MAFPPAPHYKIEYLEVPDVLIKKNELLSSTHVGTRMEINSVLKWVFGREWKSIRP